MDQHSSQQAVIALYCGIDRHSNNHVVVVDEQDRRRVEKRLPNGLRARLRLLAPYATLKFGSRA